MPGAAMVQSANSMLSTSSAAKLLRDYPNEVAELAKPGSLVGVATRVLKLSAQDKQYIQAIPDPLKEALRAAIVDGVLREKSVQLSYVPAYDFEVRISDYGGAVTIQVRGPYAPASPSAKARYAPEPRKSRATVRTVKAKRATTKKKVKPARRRTTRARRAR
jgi:hypothetical protein